MTDKTNSQTSLSNNPPSFVQKIFARRALSGIVFFCILMLATAGFLFFREYQRVKALVEAPKKTAQEELSTLMHQIGTLIELPDGEEPTVATVTNPEELRDQAFFANAQTGDKVLIYSDSKKAILYRPGMHKVIEVAPLTLGSDVDSPPGAVAAAEAPARIAVYNGTKIAGLAKKEAERIMEIAGDAEITTGDAESDTYTETVVIDITSVHSALSDTIASHFGTSVSTIPSEESVPADIDILVIVGSTEK